MEPLIRKTDDINISLIDLNPDQSRLEYDEEKLNELADSISKVGLINPISLSSAGGRYKLVAGSRRLKAFQLLNRSFIPACISLSNNSLFPINLNLILSS